MRDAEIEADSTGRTDASDLRTEAEELVRRYTSAARGLSPEEMQRLLYEFQVHLSELEMQNQELRQTQRSLERYRDRYVDLYDFAPLGYVSLDEDAYVQEINLAGAKMLGLTPAEITGYSFVDYVAPGDRDRFLRHVRECVQELKEVTGEVVLAARGGQPIPVQLRSLPIRDEDSKVTLCKTAVTDITERKRAEEEIAKLARFPSENPNPVLRISADGTILYSNPAGSPLLNAWGCGEGGSLPHDWHRLILDALGTGRSGQAELACDGRVFSLTFARVPSSDYLNVYALDITERKQAEEALRRAKEDWEGTFDTVPDLVAILDRDHRVVRANRAMAQRLKMTPQQCIGLRCYELMHGTSQPSESCPHAETCRDGREHTVELEEPRLGGNFLVTTSPRLDEEGRPTGTVHVARDITHLKRTEKALHRLNAELEGRVAEQTAEIRKTYDLVEAERQRLYDLLETLPVYVVLLSADYHVPFANRFFRERFGQSHGRRCFEYLFQRTEPCEHCETYNVLKTGAPQHWEWTGPDGRDYDIHDFPFLDSDGSRLILEMGIDITERKRAEAALRESQSRLIRAQRVGSVGVWEWKIATGELYWCDEIYRIFGLDRERFAATYDAFIASVHPDDRDFVQRHVDRAVHQNAEYSIDHRIVLPGGEVRYVHEQGEVYRDADGNPLGMLGTVLDITDRKQAEESLRETKQRLELAVRDECGRPFRMAGSIQDVTERKNLERELSEISTFEQQRIGQELHDGLGQQMLGLRLLAKGLEKSLLTHGFPEADSAGKLVEALHDCQKHVRALIEGVRPVEVDANGLTAALGNLAENTQTLTDIACTFVCDHPVLMEDNHTATQLFHIAQEAVRNGVKHAKPTRITIRLESHRGQVTLAVRDDGTGLRGDPDQMTGMGLRIMRYRAGVLGATLKIQPAVGGGTLVTCTFRQEERHDPEH